MNSREFAIDVVRKLQAAGYQALWAGGCVRDQLAGRVPKDYDVATKATPDQVRSVFGHSRTLPIGASFGVITVLGPKTANPIEVATFRRDGGYSDGRRPDSVSFTDAREDAMRRDFTINGMFFDPITEQVLDYVDGQADLAAKRIRAIGVADQRIEEDKLRMLRAVRFAATFDFGIEPNTLQAIQARAADIQTVSGERIGAELRRMLSCVNRAKAASLLRESKLLPEIVPRAALVVPAESSPGVVNWEFRLAWLAALQPHDQVFEAATVILLEPVLAELGVTPIFDGWKLSNDERKVIRWIAQHRAVLARADQVPWSVAQPLLIAPAARAAIEVNAAFAKVAAQADVTRCSDQAADSACEPEVTPDNLLFAVEFCRAKLALPVDQLNPAPLLDGAALKRLGIEPGPKFKTILERVRAQQLDGQLDSSESAAALALEIHGELVD